MDAGLQRGFRVGDYEVRPLEGRIEGPAGSEHVQPKVMEVLLCLAEQPGEVVERDTLIERVWGGTVVTDDVLTRCISELRHHLDDHHDAVRYIQTIPKRGYRLVAEVQTDDELPNRVTRPARLRARHLRLSSQPLPAALINPVQLPRSGKISSAAMLYVSVSPMSLSREIAANCRAAMVPAT